MPFQNEWSVCYPIQKKMLALKSQRIWILCSINTFQRRVQKSYILFGESNNWFHFFQDKVREYSDIFIEI